MNKNQFDVLSREERKIVEDIKSTPIPVIYQEDINVACKAAASYYAEKQSIWDLNFWKVTFSCFSTDLGFIWILLAFLIGSCVMFTVRLAIDPIAVMTALAPVPVITFAIRELQHRDNNLVQIEKTCKYAPTKIYFVRLWIGMFFNAIFVLLMGVISFSQYKNYMKLYFCSFIVMFFVGAVALFIMSFSDNTLPLSLIMAAWILSAVYFMSMNEFTYMINQMNVLTLIEILTISIGIFAVATIKTTKKLYA